LDLNIKNGGNFVTRWYYYRLARIWFRRNPFKGLLIVAALFFCAGAGAYAYLDQYSWGRIFNRLVFTMLSSEASSTTMYAQSQPFRVIIGYVIAADLCGIMIDLFVVNRLIAWKFFKSKIDWLSKQLKALFRILRGWIPLSRKKSRIASQFYIPFDVVRNHINDIKKNPSKVGLGGVMILAAIPRLPFMIVGGVSLGVFIIKYNRLGYLGWIALGIGIIGRTSFWLGSLYGVGSIL